MTTTVYKLYKKDVFALANTAIILHERAALVMNEYVRAKGYEVDAYDRSTWKYYMNLAGQYHPVDLDEINAINGGVSSYILIKTASNTGPVSTPYRRDLFEPFLGGDVVLANEYQMSGAYYQELIKTYPDYELLIRGIRYPIELTTSMRAKDGDLLFIGGYYRVYPTSDNSVFIFTRKTTTGLEDSLLIEPQETSLVKKIQQYINAFFVRWYTREYDITDDLHYPALLAMLYMHMPMQILNARLEACHTPEAHSYHIYSYLDSYGYLAKYASDLNLKEALWLYRNIDYIYKNIGKTSTFKSLLANLATPSGITLYSYDVGHDLGSQPENMLPDALVNRTPLNFLGIGSGKDKLTVAELLSRESKLAKDNVVGLHTDVVETDKTIVTAGANRYPTKYVESVMIDISDKTPFPLSKVLLNHWVYTASKGTYTGSVFVTHPVTGDRISLTPLNALILMYYCFNKGFSDFTLVHIPMIKANYVARGDVVPDGYPSVPTINDIRRYVAPSRVSDASLTALRGTSHTPYYFGSTETFFEGCLEIQQEMMRRYFLISAELDFRARAEFEIAMNLHYWISTPCVLSPTNQTYAAWFIENGISLGVLTRDEYINLGEQLLKEGTGLRDTQNKSLKRVQTAVMEIMRQLSSYSIHYNYSINDKTAITTNTNGLRLSNYRAKAKTTVLVRMPSVDVVKMVVSIPPLNRSLDTGLRTRVTVTPL